MRHSKGVFDTHDVECCTIYTLPLVFLQSEWSFV